MRHSSRPRSPFGYASPAVLAYPIGITFTPASPSILDNSAPGTQVALVTVIMSDGKPFTGQLTFATLFFDDSQLFALAGSNIVVGLVPLPAGNSTQQVTVSALQNSIAVSASLTITIQQHATPPGTVWATFQLNSPNSGTLPFTLGHPFPKGLIASGPLTLSIPLAQVIIKRTWNDGSVKHAIISGQAPLVANTPLSINVLSGSSSGTNLLASDIAAAAPSAVVSFSGGVTAPPVSLGNLLGSPVRTFVSGPQMVECHYSQRVTNGVNAPLLVIFHVRLYRNGSIWIAAKIENGYMTGSVTTTYTATYTVNNGQVFSGSITHYANTIAYMPDTWIGGDPQVLPIHDMVFVVNTKMVPNYYTLNNTVIGPPTAGVLNGLTQTYTIGSIGGFHTPMGDEGFQAPLGNLTQWECVLINSKGDSRAWNSMLSNGKCYASFAIAWRDLATDLPFLPSTNPNAFFDNNDVTFSGPGNVNVWDFNHHPSVGYFGYMLSGEYRWVETMQLTATLCYYLCNPGTFGTGTGRYVEDSQIRGRAWAMRTIGQMCAIYPGSDQFLVDFQTIMNNMALSDIADITKPGWSQLGYAVAPGSNFAAWNTVGGPTFTNSTTVNTVPSFMMNFAVAAYGHVSDAEWGSAAQMANWNQVRDFQYKWPIGLLGTGSLTPGDPAGWSFNYAAVYGVQIAPLSAPSPAFDLTQWFADWGTTASQTANLAGATTSNTIPFGDLFGGLGDGMMTYIGQEHAAIAFAVDHGASGAQAAFARLQGATNYPQIRNNTGGTVSYADYPMFCVDPRDPLTTLLANTASNTWILTNSAAGNGNYINVVLPPTVQNFSIDAWTTNAQVNTSAVAGGIGNYDFADLWAFSTPAIRSSDGKIVFQGGGHANHGDSGVYTYDLKAAAASINAGGANAGGVWSLRVKSARYRLRTDPRPAYSSQTGSNGNFFYWADVSLDNIQQICASHTYYFNLAIPGTTKFALGGSSGFSSDAASQIGSAAIYDDSNDSYTLFTDNTVSGQSNRPRTYTGFSQWSNSTGVGGPMDACDLDGSFYFWSNFNLGKWTTPGGTPGYVGSIASSPSLNGSLGSGMPGVIIPDPINGSSKRALFVHAPDASSDFTHFALWTDITGTPSLGASPVVAYASGSVGLSPWTYDSKRGRLLAFDGNLQQVVPTANADRSGWVLSQVTTGPVGSQGNNFSTGQFGRLQYLPTYDCVVLVQSGNVWIYKP